MSIVIDTNETLILRSILNRLDLEVKWDQRENKAFQILQPHRNTIKFWGHLIGKQKTEEEEEENQ